MSPNDRAFFNSPGWLRKVEQARVRMALFEMAKIRSFNFAERQHEARMLLAFGVQSVLRDGDGYAR